LAADAPISVQSMTNTLTLDAGGDHRADSPPGRCRARTSCASPARRSLDSGAENDRQASRVPIVADIHFHYKRAIEAAKAGAACLRINPGNIGSKERVREVVQAAKDHGCSMRIG
jgi:(E)-4-hydroxy-3-methylbut-2-enyl-diphosphate synthase